MNSCERSSCSSNDWLCVMPRQGIAKLGGHPVHDAARDQELSQLRCLLLQDGRSQVAGHLMSASR